MHPAELAILLHRALEVRMAHLLERLEMPAWEADAEGLHQVRVSARRLSAVLDLVDAEAYPGHKGHRRTLKQLVTALGPTRELDVHSAALQALHHTTNTPLQAASLEHLEDRLDRARAKARRTMKKDLAELSLRDLPRLLKVANLPHPFQAMSLQEAAWAALEPRLVVLHEIRDLANQEDAAALHKSRVQIKKLRYTLEAMEGAFSESPVDLLLPLRDLQTCLGSHHDLAALENWLWDQEARLRNQDRATLCGGVLDLLGSIAENRRGAFERFTCLVQEAPVSDLPGAIRRILGLPDPADRPA